VRVISARRDPGLVDGAPEAIAGMGVIVADVGRPLPGSGADEDQFQTVPK
jgi:hypothetical protein